MKVFITGKSSFFNKLFRKSIKNVENEGEYFTYKPKFLKNNNKKTIKKTSKNSAFDKLSELRLR